MDGADGGATTERRHAAAQKAMVTPGLGWWELRMGWLLGGDFEDEKRRSDLGCVASTSQMEKSPAFCPKSRVHAYVANNF